MPASKPPLRPLSKNGIRPSTSCSVTGRRNAPRARVAAMRRAHPSSLAVISRGLRRAPLRAARRGVLLSGRQTKILRRLGVSDTPGELNGPSTFTPLTRRGSRSPRLNSSPGRWPTNSSDWTRARSMNVTATSWMPAFTCTGRLANRLVTSARPGAPLRSAVRRSSVPPSSPRNTSRPSIRMTTRWRASSTRE